MFHGGWPNPTTREGSKPLVLSITCVLLYLIADHYCRNVGKRVNGGHLFYFNLPTVYAVQGFIIGDVIYYYSSMGTSEVTLHTSREFYN